MYVPLSDGLAVLPLFLERFASFDSVVVVVAVLLRRIPLAMLGSVRLQPASGAATGGGC